MFFYYKNEEIFGCHYHILENKTFAPKEQMLHFPLKKEERKRRLFLNDNGGYVEERVKTGYEGRGRLIQFTHSPLNKFVIS